MKTFIKNYISIFENMGTDQEEKIEAVIDITCILQANDKKGIFYNIIKPLLVEYRETNDTNIMLEIQDLFIELLEIL